MMTEKLSTIARPYALAAFEYALETHDLQAWEHMLQTAALITQDRKMNRLLNSPEITHVDLLEIFYDVLGKSLDAEKKNFLRLLAEYERFNALPEIVKLFSEYRSQYEKTLQVKIISATALTPSYQQKFTDALTRRLKLKIALECEVDKSLLGGAVIRAGDMVIDGSVRGKLNRLLESL